MASILAVEDCVESAALISRALSGHRLEVATTLSHARSLLDVHPDTFDLVLLDLELPDGDGLGLASELSNGERQPTPFIVLSGRSEVRHKLVAFSLGAEDYIEKPFNGLELQARIAARLRASRTEEREGGEIELGQLRVGKENMRVYISEHGEETPIELSPTEHKILEALIEVPGRVRTRESLITSIWRDEIIGHRTIDSHVSNLRRKLENAGTRIESVRGLGYRMCRPACSARS
ncbi:MAG: response regulator transcription factor [Myxococcota bacterium]